MPQYVGFSTQNYCKPATTNSIPGIDGGPGSTTNPVIVAKKFKLTDYNLVIQDLINAFNIRIGTKVGQPYYGTRIWDYLFEQNDSETQFLIENDIKTIAGNDPRIILNYVKSFPRENGILVEVEMAVTPYNQPLTLTVNFSTTTGIATLV